MLRIPSLRVVGLTFVMPMLMVLGSAAAADLDPKAINIQLPKDIKWVAKPYRSDQLAETMETLLP